jgi:hypothetical protein
MASFKIKCTGSKVQKWVDTWVGIQWGLGNGKYWQQHFRQK